MAPVIEIRNLKKYFSTPRGMLHAVDDVTFTIEKGKTLGVVGESGCGKSTLGRTIIHLHESTSGEIFLDGRDITKLKGKALKDVREEMQIIFQDPYSSLDPRKTIEKTIREPLMISGRHKRDEIDAKVEEIMDLVGIAARLRQAYPHELDGGRRQRVASPAPWPWNPSSWCATSRCPPWTCPSRPRCSTCSRSYSRTGGSPTCSSPMTCRWSGTSRTTSA